jgi:hypothetical protein
MGAIVRACDIGLHANTHIERSSVVEDFDFAFAENGLTAFKMGQPLASQSFIKHVGEERYKILVNFILHYIADMDIPIKRYFAKAAHNCT